MMRNIGDLFQRVLNARIAEHPGPGFVRFQQSAFQGCLKNPLNRIIKKAAEFIFARLERRFGMLVIVNIDERYDTGDLFPDRRAGTGHVDPFFRSIFPYYLDLVTTDVGIPALALFTAVTNEFHEIRMDDLPELFCNKLPFGVARHLLRCPVYEDPPVILVKEHRYGRRIGERSELVLALFQGVLYFTRLFNLLFEEPDFFGQFFVCRFLLCHDVQINLL